MLQLTVLFGLQNVSLIITECMDTKLKSTYNQLQIVENHVNSHSEII